MLIFIFKKVSNVCKIYLIRECEIYLIRGCMLIFKKKFSLTLFWFLILLNFNFNPKFFFKGIGLSN